MLAKSTQLRKLSEFIESTKSVFRNIKQLTEKSSLDKLESNEKIQEKRMNNQEDVINQKKVLSSLEIYGLSKFEELLCDENYFFFKAKLV